MTRPYRRVQIRCQCPTCVSDRWARRIAWGLIALAIVVVLAQIVRAYILPVVL